MGESTSLRSCVRGLAVAGVSAVITIHGAAAQDGSPQGRGKYEGIEDIVVTRPQGGTASTQDISLSVTPFSGEQLEQRGLGDLARIGDLVPNVGIDNTSPFSGSSSVLSPFIRGIGQNDFAFNLEPGVGVYVDGVYLARTIGANADLLDLDRVEVLKGPQGTVFGRNTIGGALNVITRRPANELNYKLETTVGRFDRADVRGAIDVPLVPETVLSQFSFSSKRRNGYQDRGPFPGGDANSDEAFFSRAAYKAHEHSGGQHQDSYRGKLVWLASDRFEGTLTADYANVNEEGIPGSLVNINTGIDPSSGQATLAGLYNTCISTPAGTLAEIGLGAVCGPRGLAPTRSNRKPGGTPLPGLAGVNVDADPSNDRLPFSRAFISDKDHSFATGSNFSRVTTSGVALTGNWTLTDTLSLKSISGFRRLTSKFGTDLDGSPIDIIDTSFLGHQKQYSQELQLVGSSFDRRLNWVVGSYYFFERGDLTDFVPFAEGISQVDGRNEFENIAFAGFTNLSYGVTDRFALSFGARYTDEHKDLAGKERDLNALTAKFGTPASAFPDPNDVTRIFPLGKQRVEFDDISVRLAAEYTWSDEIFTYASYAQGTKSGGFTTRLLAPENPPDRAPAFDPETADSFEVGLKSRFFNRRLQANLAAFYTVYDNIQVTVQRGVSPTFENAGRGIIQGVELEFQSLITDRLRVDGGLGILDAHFTRLEPGTVLDRGDRFVNTPDFSANVSSSYAIPISLPRPVPLDGELTLQADYTHRSNVANDAENNPLFFASHSNVVNAALNYSPSEPGRLGRWNLTLGVTNLTDTRFVTSGFENASVGFSFANFSRPREWYLRLNFQR